jgi:hypothetical protein
MNLRAFFKRYIDFNLSNTQEMEGTDPVLGSVLLLPTGELQIQASSEILSPDQFLERRRPELTEEGRKKALEDEGSGEDSTDPLRIDSALSLFRKDASAVNDLAVRFGVNVKQIAQLPLWSDIGFNRVKYAMKDAQGHYRWIFEWEIARARRFSTGVQPFPLDFHQAPEVWLVDDPVIQSVLGRILNLPVLIWPTLPELGFHEWGNALTGKDIVVLSHEDSGDYENRAFEFLREIRGSVNSITQLYVEPLTGGRPFCDWFGSQGAKDTLLEKVKQSPGITLIPSKEDYHRLISVEKSEAIYLPQDFKRGEFFYALSDGSVVTSAPINILKQTDIQSEWNLEPVTGTSGGRLTSEMVFQIQASHLLYTPGKLFTEIRRMIPRFIFLEREEDYDLLSIWVMGTYIYAMFPAYGYLHLNGSAGSGKSTLIEILCSMSFNGKAYPKITMAELSTQVHQTGGTMGVDEFEKEAGQNKLELVQVLNAGYKRGGEYASAGKVRRLFSPKILSGIEVLESTALRSRTIPVNLVQKSYDVNLQIWDPNDPDVRSQVSIIQKGGYALGLFYHGNVLTQHRRLPPEIDLGNGCIVDARRREILAPLFSIARTIDTELPKEDVETRLKTAIVERFFPKNALDEERRQLLENVLSTVSSDHCKGDVGGWWIVSDSVQGSMLAQFESKTEMLDWLRNLGVSKAEPKYMSALKESKSCVFFRSGLKIHKSMVSEIFSQKTANAA